jgi:hypothetical protein
MNNSFEKSLRDFLKVRKTNSPLMQLTNPIWLWGLTGLIIPIGIHITQS